MHEMTENDSAVYFKQPAWHGLGNVIEDPIDIWDGMYQAGLNWTVTKHKGISVGGNGYIYSPNYHAIVRDDTMDILGIVSEQYKVLQNEEIFRLAQCFGSDAKVESAGSIQDGRKIYLLLRGTPFDAIQGDVVERYMALLWGHDGTLSAHMFPTSIRVVCKNTMDMAMGSASKKVIIKHSGDMESKLEFAREAISRFKETGSLFAANTQQLARVNVDTATVNRFFWNIYESMHGAIPVDPTTEKEEQQKVKAVTTMSKWVETLEDEAKDFGVNLWIAANAVTNDIQHSVGSRGRKKTPASSAYGNLVGKGAKDSSKVLAAAIQMAK